MKRFLSILLMILLSSALEAQTMDDELTSLVEVVLSLREQDAAHFNKAVEQLTDDTKWTAMDELGVLKSQECKPTDNVPSFKLNRILNKAESGRRYVSQRGDFLNGEDPRYCYSLFERSVKADSMVTYTLKGRVGAQTFVIIPFEADANLSVEFFSPDVFFAEVKNTVGMSVFRSDAGQKADSYITIKVKNLDNTNHSFVIINHNTREGSDDSNDGFRLLMDTIFSQGNRWYDLNNRLMVNEMADSMDVMLKKQSSVGRLSELDSLTFTADIYKLRGDYHYINGSYEPKSYSQASEFFEKALQIYNAHPEIGRNHQKTVIHHELAQLYYKQKNYSEALYEMYSVCSDYNLMIDNQEISSTDKTHLDMLSQRAICLARVGRYEEALASITQVIDLYNDKKNAGYYEALRKKAKIIVLRNDGKDFDMALSYYKQYFDYQRIVCKERLFAMTDSEKEQFWMMMRPFVADCYSLESQDAAFLYDVTLFVKGLLLEINKMNGKSMDYSWSDVQKTLKAGSCAIEFVQYEKGDDYHMAALFVGNAGKPQFIKLTDPDVVLDFRINKWNVRKIINSPSKEKINYLYTDTSFPKKVWTQPLVDAMAPFNTVYFSPDGYMHRVAIEYVLPECAAGKKLHRLTSTRRLLEKRNSLGNGNALIIGDVNYNKSNFISADANGNDAVAYNNYRGRYKFSTLEMSRGEIDSIKFLRGNPNDTVISGSMATETTFRKLCGRYPLVFASTHGYHIADDTSVGTELKPCLSDAALSENVIVLAGANNSLHDKRFDASTHFDGLLSAREMYDLDMSATGLVVLSACQSGLGDVSSDGVYGLQRGLKNAGVGAMVLSLWNVNDDAARIFVTKFCRYLKMGHLKDEAFRLARESLKTYKGKKASAGTKYDDATMADVSVEVVKNVSYEAPFYWAAFIMIDDF